jgi:hypothetical protein
MPWDGFGSFRDNGSWGVFDEIFADRIGVQA